MLVVEFGKGLGAGDLLQLAAEPRDLGAELGDDDSRALAAAAAVGLAGEGQVLEALVQRDERVPDAEDELAIVGHLPGLEVPEVGEEQRGELRGEVAGNVAKSRRRRRRRGGCCCCYC